MSVTAVGLSWMTSVAVDEIMIKMVQYTKTLSVMNIFLCVLLLFQSLTIIATITWSVTYITPRLSIYDWPKHLLTMDELKYRKPIDKSFGSKQTLRLDNSTRTCPDTKNVVSTSGIIVSDLSVTILATFNDGFVDFLCNWLKSLSRLNIYYNITLIAEDATAFQKFFKVRSAYQTNMSIKLYYTNSRFVEKALPGANTPQYRAIVCKRPRYILDVLSADQDVLFVDIDAVWLRNPLSLIASQYHQYDSWVATGFDGVTPCPCFLYLKSNNASKGLVNDWLTRVKRNQCYTNVHAENEMTALGKVMKRREESHLLKVKKLPEIQFPTGESYFLSPKWREANKEYVYVVHGNRLGRHSKKKEWFKGLRLWYLND